MLDSLPIREISRETEPKKYTEAHWFLNKQIFGDQATGNDKFDNNPGDRVIVLEDESGEVVAAGKMAVIDQDRYEVSLLGIAKDARRQGLGSILLSEIEQMAREDGAKTIEATCASTESAEFFESHGYEDSPYRETDYTKQLEVPTADITA